MNHKENEIPNSRYLLDHAIGYQQRYQSPDSDTASSTSSIFSTDYKSSQDSPATSPAKSERVWEAENKPRLCGYGSTTESRSSIQIQQLVSADTIEPRLNPRRTQCAAQSSVCQTQNRGPPQLTRQCDRTQNFVENLVDTATQMVEAIWPLTVNFCDKDNLGGSNLIGLRTFIQEVLKRSKTSYYTLQVALYYLILIKPHVADIDHLAQQKTIELTHAQRAMRCGRRMFLAALMLASKYLQDRNYSARAWSKISGLKIAEINSNEIVFSTAVEWKFHIPEPHFQRWANIVFKYSTSQPSTLSSLHGRDAKQLSWRQIIPRLTPELDEVDLERFAQLSLRSTTYALPLPTPAQSLLDYVYSSHDGDKTPTPATMRLPPITVARTSPPASPRIPALPTPIMTPQLSGFCPPAARTWCPGQAMRETMHQIQQQSFKNASYDEWPATGFLAPRKPLNRVLSNCSIISSPESMISDITQNSCSSRTSRSSSICSVASSVGALLGCKRTNPPANHRSALATLNGSNYMPTCTGSLRFESYPLSAENGSVDNAEMDATLALLHLARPDANTVYTIPSQSEPGQKRARPLSVIVDNNDNIPQDMRSMLSYTNNTKQECAGLPDRTKADSVTLSQPNLVTDSLNTKPSTGSQAGARKKRRNCSRGNSSWVSTSSLTGVSA